MKVLLTLIALAACAGCTNVFAQQPSVTLENIHAEYRSLSEIKPVLFNAGERSIYLLQKECGEAQVTFVEEDLWEWGRAKECPDFDPVEIKPGERYQLPSPVMRIEAGEGEFREEKDGPPGRYIIAVSFSLNPSFVVRKPELARSLSKKFSIVR